MAGKFATDVAARIIEQLKQGTAPWQKPWDGTAYQAPYNPISGTRYKGANNLYLGCAGYGDPRWMTYKQAAGKGYQVKKGEKGQVVQYWKFNEKRDKLDESGKPVRDENGKKVQVTVQLDKPKCFHAVVFNAQQMDGVPALEKREYEWEPNERAEAILKGSGADIRHQAGDRAYYSPVQDHIVLPEKSQFQDAGKYAAVGLHELGHWTGHQSRLDRDLSGPFGSESYASEEMRVEIASMLVGAEIGTGHDPGQHVAYVGSWIKALENDPNEIVRAARDAEQIMEYVLGLEHEVEIEKEHTAELKPSFAELTQTHDDVMAVVMKQHQTSAEQNIDSALSTWENLKQVASDHGLEAGLRWAEEAHFTPVEVIYAKDCEVLPVTSDFLPGDAKAMTLVDGQRIPGTGLTTDSEWQRDALKAGISKALELQQSVEVVGQSVPQEKDLPEREANMSDKRTYINVNYKERAEAKALGAKWDGRDGVKSWFVPSGVDVKPFEKWMDKEVSVGIPKVGQHPVPRSWQGAACGVYDEEMMKLRNDGVSDSSAIDRFKTKELHLEQGNHKEASKIDEWLQEHVYHHPVVREEVAALIEGSASVNNLDAFSYLAESGSASDQELLAELKEDQKQELDFMEGFNSASEQEAIAEFKSTQMVSYLTDRVGISADQAEAFQKSRNDAPDLFSGVEENLDTFVRLTLVSQTPEVAERKDALKSAISKGVDTYLENTLDIAKEKTFLAVPYEARNDAKALGAKWDKEAKSWYAPEGVDMTGLKKWVPENVQEGKEIDPREEFGKALEDAGFILKDDHPRMDGKLHRLETKQGSRGNQNGAYKGFLDGHPAGFIENHATGEKTTWKASGVTLSPEERAKIQAEAAVKKQLREAETTRKHQHHARRCEAAYSLMKPATQENGYLKAKGVSVPPGAREDKRGRLVIPLRDQEGRIWSLQRIGKSGFKSMKKGAKKSGNSFVMGDKDLNKTEAILITEGVATGASVHMATGGMPVVVAFDAGNLNSVANSLKESYPDKEIVILGDDDRHMEGTKTGNRGRADAEKVAEKVGGNTLFPQFGKNESGKEFKDWNDLHKARGLETVKRQVTEGLNRIKQRRQVEQQKQKEKQRVQVQERGGRSQGIGR